MIGGSSSAGRAAALTAAHAVAARTSSPSALWYTTRATGVVAFILLTLAVALGVAGAGRLDSSPLPRLVRAGLHRNVSLLAVAFVVVHVVTAILDPFAGIRAVSAVIPFTSAYRPVWLSLGTVTLDLLIALTVTSLLRARLSYRAWRTVHWLAYLSWPAALWHALGTGTDSRLPWLLALDAACLAVVAAAVALRLRLTGDAALRRTGPVVTAAVLIATVVFAAAGPLQPGWARRSGTPPRLLSAARPQLSEQVRAGANR